MEVCIKPNEKVKTFIKIDNVGFELGQMASLGYFIIVSPLRSHSPTTTNGKSLSMATVGRALEAC